MRNVVVNLDQTTYEAALSRLEYCAQSIRVRLVRTEKPEVGRLGIPLVNVAKVLAELPGRFVTLCSWFLHLKRIITEGRQVQRHRNSATIGMRVVAHAALTFRSELGILGAEAPVLVEELFRFVAAHPLFQELQVRRIIAYTGKRHLVSTEGSFDGHPIDHLRTGPTFRRSQNDRRPHRPFLESMLPRVCLDLPNPENDCFERGRKVLMDFSRIAAFDKESLITVSCEKVTDVFVGLASPDCWAGNFVTVKMQDWKYRSIAHRIEEFHTLPAALKRARFGLSIADDSGNNQLGVIESCT